MGVAVSDPLRVAANTTTGQQTLTFTWPDGSSYTPKAVLLIATRCVTDGTAADGAGFYYGLSDGTNEGAGAWESQHAQASMDAQASADTTANRILTIYDGAADAAVDGTADFVSFGTDNCIIDWTNAPGAAFLLTAVAFSGTDLSAKVGLHDTGTTTDALLAFTDVGFEADVVLVFWNHSLDGGGMGLGVVHNNRAGTVTQRGMAHIQRSGFGSSQVGAHLRDGEALVKLLSSTQAVDFWGRFESFDSSGWDVQLGNARAPVGDYVYLALRFGESAVVDAKVYTYSTPTGTGSNTDNGPGFEPQFVMYLMSRAAAVDTSETDADGGSVGVLFTSDGATYANAIADEDAAADSNTQSLSDNQLNLPTHTGASGHAATLTSMGSTGPVWNYSATDATARLWGALAIEVSAGGGGGGPTPKKLALLGVG